MSILSINLDSGAVGKEESHSSSFSFALDYLASDKNALFILAPFNKEIGAKEVSFIYTSPISGKINIQYSKINLSDMLSSLGYDGVLITGSSRKLSYILIDKGSVDIFPSESLRGKSSKRFEEILKKNPNDIVLANGSAGDNGVIFAQLQHQGKNIRCEGLGNVFFQKNLKGLIVSALIENEDGVRQSKTKEKLEKSKLVRRVKREGSCTFISDGLRLGWIPIKNYSSRFDPRAYNLDGKSIKDQYGVHPTTCTSCLFSCGREGEDNGLLPYWKDMVSLGTNLSIFSIESVAKLYRAALEEGLDTLHLGALLSYVLNESDDDMRWLGLKERNVDEIVSLIHRIGAVKEAGLRYKEGLKAFPGAYQNGYNQPLQYDIRGSFGEALLSLLGINLDLPISLFMPKHEMDEKTSVVFALYEAIYSLALISLGYSPLAAAAYAESIPEFAYHSPFIARIVMRSISFFGYKPKELFEIGLPLFEAIAGEKNTIPDHFTSDGESALSFRTVSPVKLLALYREEKLKAEIWAKSRSEIKRAH